LTEEIKREEIGAENTTMKLNQTTQSQNSCGKDVFLFQKNCNKKM
jgi:hypothetical protein